jgi:hypothetical protein
MWRKVSRIFFEDLRDAFTETAARNIPGNAKPPGLWTLLKRTDSENELEGARRDGGFSG